MKLITFLITIILMVNLFISCTPNDSVEEGLQFESQSRSEYGEEETPMDDDRER